jgi:hypothetical protein
LFCIFKSFRISCSFILLITAFWSLPFLKMTVFCEVPCSLVEVYQHFRGTCCLHYQGNDRGSRHLSKVSKLIPDYIAQHPIRQSSSYLSP